MHGGHGGAAKKLKYVERMVKMVNFIFKLWTFLRRNLRKI